MIHKISAHGQCNVLPKRLTEEYGYAFVFPELDGALRELLGDHRKLERL